MVEDPRFSKIDEAIQRLASVSADLSKMLAVQEQRIGTQEKTSDSIIAMFEKRRAEIDVRFREIHSDVQEELRALKQNSTKQHEDQNEKIEAIQKYIWMAMGVVFVASWIIPIIVNKLFH